MWSEDFLDEPKWEKIRSTMPKGVVRSWNDLSERIKRESVKRCAQRLMESESVSESVIDPFLRDVVSGKAFEPEVGPEDIASLIPKPNPLTENLVPMEKADPGIPGEIVVDANGKLLLRYLSYTGFTKFLRDSYDEWLETGLVPLIQNQVIHVQGGRIKFEHVSLTRPRVGGRKLFPRMAREKGITYGLDIHAYVILEKDVEEGKVVRTVLGDKSSKTKKHLGTIPLMLGSKRCYLHNLSPSQLREIEEDPSDPFGYFVVSGSEKVILLHEKLRLNRIFVTSKKRGKDKDSEASITIETPSGSVRVNLIMGKGKRVNFETRFTAEVKPAKRSRKGKERVGTAREPARSSITSKKDGNYRYIGVEKLFYILQLLEEPGITDEGAAVDTDSWPEEMTRKIVQFTRDEWKHKVALETSMMRMLYPNDKPSIVKQEIAHIKGGADLHDPESIDEVVKTLIRKELFPQLNGLGRIQNIYTLKSDMLAMMVARLIEVNLGLMPYDDRDSWSNKRLETASRAMDQLMRAIWRRFVNSIKKELSDKKTIDYTANIKTQIGKAATSITQTFESSFVGTNWGVQGSMKTNMTQTPNRDSVIALLSHMHRVEVATNRNDKQPSIRMIHGTQWGYVCVTGDTEVSIDQNHTIPISKLQDGDSVLTVSKDDLVETPSRIKNYFQIKPEKLLKITTISGRTIKCTPDHPFLVKSPDFEHYYVKAGDLNVNDMVVIKNVLTPIAEEKQTELMIKSALIPAQYRLELQETGLVDKRLTQKQTETLARLLGAVITDGSITLRKSGYYDLSFYLGEEADVMEITDDILFLGFTHPSIRRKISRFNEKCVHRTWEVSKNGAFACFMAQVGAFVGKKTEQNRKIPDWIMNANLKTKRAFLSGFQGGDGGKVTIYSNIKKWKLSIIPTYQFCKETYLQNTIEYLNQIKKLFSEFGVNGKVTSKISEDKLHAVSLSFDGDIDNVVKYVDNITYSYCYEKRRRSSPAIEYIKHKMTLLTERRKAYNNAYTMFETHSLHEISIETGISKTQLSRLKTQKAKGKRPKPRCDNIITYEEFVSKYKDFEDKLAMPIHKIEEIPVEYVYDFETVHTNHSFIANGFVTHNCPVESPEGSNCHHKLTMVETPLGPKEIYRLQDGDEVICVDPITHTRSTTQIYDHFMKEAEMFEIKTLGGWTAKSTIDHPYLKQGNLWEELGNLRVDEDCVYVQYRVNSKPHIREESDIFTIIDSIRLPSLRSSLQSKATETLREMEILPLSSHSKYLPILARIVGYSFGDASIHQSKTGSCIWTGFFGQEHDAIEFENDMSLLGFAPKTAKRRTNTRVMKDGREITETVYTINRGGEFCYLLMALGVPVGKKTRNPYSIPHWIKCGSPLVQREFLAGFQGADGGSPCWKKRPNKKNAYHFSFGLTRKHKTQEHLASMIEFFEDMKTLYKDLGVNTKNRIAVKKAYDDMYNVELQFSSSMDSVIDYAENVGYRYCQTKTKRLEKVYFYFRYKREAWQQRLDLKKEIIERHSKGEISPALAKEKGLTVRQISGMLEQADKKTYPPRDLLNIDDFLVKYYDDQGCFLPVISIVPAGKDMVCDFTTVSDNHSFIANGFVTHNCGIVKNLAVTAQVTYEKPDHNVIARVLNAKAEDDSDLFSIIPSPRYTSPVLVNGKFLGWCAGKALRRHMVLARRERAIPLDTGITLNTRNNLLIHTDTSRLVRPLLVVEPVKVGGKEKHLPLILTKDLLGAPIKKLFEEGVIEYVDSFEVESVDFFVAETFEDTKNRRVMEKKLALRYAELKKEMKKAKGKKRDFLKVNLEKLGASLLKIRNEIPFTHVEMDPTSILGISANIIPYPNHNQGPRNTYQSSMAKQALGIMRAHHMACFNGKHKVLAYPTRPLFEPQINQLLNLNAYPQGEMVWVAFGEWTGNTQEDAVVWNRASIDMGKFRIFKFNNNRVTFKSEGGKVEKLQRPTKISDEQLKTRFQHIGRNGLPKLGAHIKERQAVVGKVVMEGKEEKHDDSLLLGYGEEGIVDKVMVTNNGAVKIVNVRLRMMRIPIEGDKFAPRNAQKGTIGKILDPEDMPYTEDGIIPDVIVNSHATPSRMTIAYQMELLAGVAGAIVGQRQNATAFRHFDKAKFKSILRDYGYSDTGKRVMYSGTTGRKIEAEIYNGPAYFQALRHHVQDKIQARRTGPYSATSRQPVKGRAKMGGLRFGEMERDAAIAHGAAYFLQERLCGVSDCYKSVFCKCGQPAEGSLNTGYSCRLCGDETTSGALQITAALKLLNMIVAGLGFKQGFKFNEIEEQRSRMFAGGHIAEAEREYAVENVGDDYGEEEL